jgi:hypothetical protein
MIGDIILDDARLKSFCYTHHAGCKYEYKYINIAYNLASRQLAQHSESRLNNFVNLRLFLGLSKVTN